MKKEPGLKEEEEEDDTNMNLQITASDSRNGNDPFFDHEDTPAVAVTDRRTYANAFIPHAQAAIERMAKSDEVEEVKYADTPGFATVEQIRASFLSRRKSGGSPLKRKRGESVVVIKEEPVSASSTQEQELDEDLENQVSSNTTPKRNRFAAKNPRSPCSVRQIAQGDNTAPAKLALGRRTVVGEKNMLMTMDDEDDSGKKLKEVTDLVNHLDILIGNAQKKLRDDVHGAGSLLTAAKKLIRESLVSQVEKKEEVDAVSRDLTGSVWGEPTGAVSRDPVGYTSRMAASRAAKEEAMYRDSSEDGV